MKRTGGRLVWIDYRGGEQTLEVVPVDDQLGNRFIEIREGYTHPTQRIEHELFVVASKITFDYVYFYLDENGRVTEIYYGGS